MNLQQMQDFFAQLPSESITGLILNMALVVILSYTLSLLYVRYGRSFSDRDVLGKNFVLLAMTTMLVITVIKSSLALSLGLVGALSIVRFRTAIKEPEELAYLFICIGIGLGMGAAARRTTLIACGAIFFIIWLKGQRELLHPYPNLSLIVSKKDSSGKALTVQQLVDITKKYCTRVDVIRFEEVDDHMEASFHIECRSFEDVQAMRDALKGFDRSIDLTFIDNSAGKTL